MAVIPIPTALPSEIAYDQAMRLFQYDRSRTEAVGLVRRQPRLDGNASDDRLAWLGDALGN